MSNFVINPNLFTRSTATIESISYIADNASSCGTPIQINPDSRLGVGCVVTAGSDLIGKQIIQVIVGMCKSASSDFSGTLGYRIYTPDGVPGTLQESSTNTITMPYTSSTATFLMPGLYSIQEGDQLMVWALTGTSTNSKYNSIRECRSDPACDNSALFKTSQINPGGWEINYDYSQYYQWTYYE
tara:strand:- start:141 stop:695 length:555 start_codon:yes stop_codon:yes gene_type:complete